MMKKFKEMLDSWMINKIYFGGGWISKIHSWYKFGWPYRIECVIHNIFNDPYKKERKTIPRFLWRDRDWVIEDFLFEMFRQYCDVEDPNWERLPDYNDWPEINHAEKIEEARKRSKK